jgi:hypothetical protein
MKTCSACHVTKPLDEFGNRKRYLYGKDSVCRACIRAQKQQYRLNHGTPVRPHFLERIWWNIQVCAHGDTCIYCCWPWMRTRDKKGYGCFTFRTADGIQHSRIVTRIVYEIWNTCPILHDLNVLHHCDSPSCCNPMHFFLGTYQDNADDSMRKGRRAQGMKNGKYTKPERTPRGVAHGMAILVEADILTIRSLYHEKTSLHALSKRYGVSVTHISRIVNRKVWKHI